MRILVPVDGNAHSRKTIRFLGTRSTLLGHDPLIKPVNVQNGLPEEAVAGRFGSRRNRNQHQGREAQKRRHIENFRLCGRTCRTRTAAAASRRLLGSAAMRIRRSLPRELEFLKVPANLIEPALFFERAAADAF